MSKPDTIKKISEAISEGSQIAKTFYEGLPCNVVNDSGNASSSCQESTYNAILNREQEFKNKLKSAVQQHDPYSEARWEQAIQSLKNRKLIHQGGAEGEKQTEEFFKSNPSLEKLQAMRLDLDRQLAKCNADALTNIGSKRPVPDEAIVEMNRVKTILKLIDERIKNI